MIFIPQRESWRVRLRIFTEYAIKAAKRFFGTPDFNYYCIQDGVKSIFHANP